jgi:hypothetical protein
MSRAGNISALGTLAGMGSIGQGRLLQGIGARRGGYSRGQGLLDQYLVGQDVGAQKDIREAATQSFGAAQEAQTGANVAREQAEGLKKSIESEKAEAQKGILKSLAGSQEQATQSAKNYLQQVDRIKNFLMGELPPEQMTEEDKLALSNLEKYGLNTAQIYGEDVGNLDTLINSIASSAPVAFTGQQKYQTEAEQKAAKNLALLSGQSDIANKIGAAKFDAQVFEGGNKAVEAYKSGAEKSTQQLEQTTGINTPEQAKQIADKYNQGWQAKNSGKRGDEHIQGDQEKFAWFTGGRDYEGDFESLLKLGGAPGTFLRAATDMLGPQAIWNIYTGTGLGGKTQYRRNRAMDTIAQVYNAKLNSINQLNNRYQSRTNLQDYINKKFGLPSPQANPQEVENE